MSLPKSAPIARLIAVMLVAPTALAAEPPAGGPQASELQEVTITATRTPLALLEVPATVSVIDAQRIEHELATDIKELVRYEPGVSVRNARGRFGLTDFNIRGIEGNRVLLEVDAVRLPESFAIGSFSNATRDGVDVDLLKRVDIVRGAASALYGSNAIGGVVAFTTKDPVDLLRDGQSLGASLKFTYGEEDEGAAGTGAIAARGEQWSGLFAYTRRDSSEFDNQGRRATLDATRTAPTPQEGYSDSFLAKALWQPNEAHTLRLTLEQSRTDVFSDVIGARTSNPTLTVLSLLGNDEQQRARVSLAHEFRLGRAWVDGGEWRLYRQDSETTQYTSEERRVTAGTATTLRLRQREFHFAEDATGAELTLRKALRTGRVEHLLTSGVEFVETDIDQLRDGFELNRTTGIRSAFVGIETFPVRDTPLTRTREMGMYLQDELRLGAWTITPSVRVDRYDLDPSVDAIFTTDNPGIVPASLSDTTVSPRLGVVWRASDQYTAFASYSAGFRAPPFGDVNVGFTNAIARYTTLPNADLEPETSDNVEVGLRWTRGAAFASLSVYSNRFDDFIESFSFVGIQPGTGFTVFQSRNLDDVEIHGVEIKGAVPLRQLLPGLALRGAFSWGEGDERNADVPLNTVDPARAVIGLQYRADGARWGAEFVTTAVERKRRIDQTAGPFFAPPGYITVDLLADWRISERASINAGVFNVTDRKYWEWADVRGRLASDPTLDFYTQPGRSLGAQLRLSW
jgi:hemoglobin/transferrin/lactoferrin receptor protein